MDLATTFGIIGGVLFVLGGGLMEEVNPAYFLHLSPVLIIFGGTMGATLASVGMREFRLTPTYLRIAFGATQEKPLVEEIQEIVSFAEKGRREGLLSLEEHIKEMEPGVSRQILGMIVDGTEPGVIQRVMETEIGAMEERHKKGSALFTAAGGYSPTLGIIGTVMGVIAVLANLEGGDLSKLGGGVATAFVATFFGISLANLVLLPIAEKLKHKSEEEIFRMRLIFEGFTGLQSGESPHVVQMRMNSFLETKSRPERE